MNNSNQQIAEEWKDIVGLEGRYQISNTGCVRSLITDKVLALFKNRKGYLKIYIAPKCYSVHRLVARAFVENWNDRYTVNHKDGNKENNYYTNLEPATTLQNIRHAFKIGLRMYDGKINIYVAKVKDTSTGKVYSNYRAAAKVAKVQPGYMSLMLRGKRNNTTPFQIFIPYRMVSLPNGCSRSKISVTPKNWDKKNAPMNTPWRIHYRFYMKGKAHQIVIKGMNVYNRLQERQEATKSLIRHEEHRIDIEGYNPVTKVYMAPEVTGEVSPDTRFFTALELAKGMLKIVPAMALDIKSMLARLKKCGGKLEDIVLEKKYSDLKIAQVKRRHLVYLLDRCQKDYPSMSNYRRNKYRTALIMLFKQLLVLEAVESNPALLLPIEKHTYKKRKLLTAAEWLIIDTNLKPRHYYFWRYWRIFFRSGSRSTELLTLKNDRNIDLERQEFTIVVKKGRSYREEIRPIPVDVLDLWAEVLDETKPGEYLFGTGFKPGLPLAPEHVNRTWKKLVKEDMEIDKDFYSLKHLNADLIAEKLGLKYAAAGAGWMKRRLKNIIP